MKAKILVIDDEQDIREIIVRFLEKAGDYDILEAVNGKHGIRMFEKHRPMVVITDLKMSYPRGEEVVRHIKRTANNAKIICMTGETQLEPVAKAAGCDIFLKKPFHLLQLKEAVEKLIRESHANILTCR